MKMIILLPFHHNFFSDNTILFLSTFTISDLINLIGIVINVILAVWIVNNIQDKLNNKRNLKNHFIVEVKELREAYKRFFNRLYTGKLKPKEILPWFKLMNIKSTDLLELLNKKCNIEKSVLNPYTIDLRQNITELETYISNYQNDDLLELTYIEKTKIIKFQQKNNSIFNKLIMDINDN